MKKTAYGSWIFQGVRLKQSSESSQTLYDSYQAHKAREHLLPAKMFRVMRMLAFLLFAAFLSAQATGTAQSVTLSGKHLTLKQVFSAIEGQTNYAVFYNKKMLEHSKPISLEVYNMPLPDFLSLVLNNQSLEYVIQGKTVILSQKVPLERSPEMIISVGGGEITGQVVDTLGLPLVGASVKLSPGNKGSSSGQDGTFMISNVNPGKYTIEISLIGHEPVIRKITITETAAVNLGAIQMRVTNVSLEDVEIVRTGMFNRNKATFTGVTRTISGKELRAASRTNILEGLNMLDPSFKIIRNNNLGSDPNQMPKIEMRGSRSMPPPTTPQYSQQLKLEYEHDPNQPLFILDGFETTLATIVNLDVNRIATVTLLKDAASTALYGSRSANGVVVVETVQPVAGAISLSYNVTATLAVPDLSGYNLMNAKELLEFQELASMGYDAPGPFYMKPPYFYYPGYDLVTGKLKQAFRQNAVTNGINSDWKNVPLRNAGAFNHVFSITGGDAYFKYNIGFTKGTKMGVMKGSENGSTSGFATLTYRMNKINVSNNLTISGNKMKGTAYGSFSDFVRVPPYYLINNVERYLEEHYFVMNNAAPRKSFSFPNPLYNALLPSKNTVKNSGLVNNLMVNWDALPNLRVSGNFQYRKSNVFGDYFVTPLHTQFDGIELTQKGSYQFQSSLLENYTGNVTLTYNQVFAGKHILNMNLRNDLTKNIDERQAISAVGYSTTSEPLLYLANSYLPDSRPNGSTNTQTSMAIIGSLNYSYDMRYNLDLSYNLSGTSSFGSDNPYQSFYAIGVGWNIGKELMLENSSIVDALNIHANFGLTGNQNAGNFGSRSTYALSTIPTFFGEAVRFQTTGNPNLDWTKTYNLSYNISGTFFKKKLSFSLSGYRNLTDPMIVMMPVPPSIGVPEGVSTNIGKLTAVGLEFTLNAVVLNNRNWTINIGINAPLYNKEEYSGLGDKLSKYNDSARSGGFMQRYYDGASPHDIWAVRSIGIGQLHGLELFLDKNGQYTPKFNINDEVAVGSSRPVSQGNVSLNLRYKRFTLGIYTRYLIDEMKFNSALYNKIEKIDPGQMEQNQDKRALYVRWKKMGDDASFLGITSLSQGMSSRFLQKESGFFVDAINFNFDLLHQYSQGLQGKIKRKLGLQGLNLGVTTSQLLKFQFTNVKMEKGIDYPFERSISVNMSVVF